MGPLIPFDIEHVDLLELMKQFAQIVKHLYVRGYVPDDLSYYNLLQHHAEGPDREDQHVRALLDMKTLLSLQQVPCFLLHNLLQRSFDVLSFAFLSQMKSGNKICASDLCVVVRSENQLAQTI